jgi:DNA polymerase delta subunit 2
MANPQAHEPSAETTPAPSRGPSDYSPLQTFVLPKGADRHYAQQFADMYFLRLAQLKKAVKAKAHDAWDGFEVQ